MLVHPVNREGQDPSSGGVLSSDTAKPPTEPESPFAGKGELLEADDAETFTRIHALVQRQEPLATNRLQLDIHYTAIKLGYPSSLIKVEDQNRYKQSYPAGSLNRLTTGAVPNKQADLCQKLVETLLVDPPKLEPEATDDDEAAHRGAELAREYLAQDAGESGTDDLTLFAAQVEGATTRASTFNHYWVDPVGGGSVAKQVKAHPQATDPANPLDAVDPATGRPIPTTDYILRYVTAGDENGQGAQFTVNPSEAERVWVPRVRVDKLGREHVRLYPETADIHHAQQVVILWFCTVAEAKRRWPDTVGQMTEEELGPLCQWAPSRAGVLLPASMRTRWREARSDSERGKGDDQRLLFHYTYYGLSEPDYPEGAAITVSGANGGYVFGKDTLVAEVTLPSEQTQDEEVTDRRDLDIPVVQVRPLADVDEKDPTGTAFMARIAGAGEASMNLTNAMFEAIDVALHPVRYSIGTSSVDADDVESARVTGDFAHVLNKDEVPVAEEPPELPSAFWNMDESIRAQMDSAAGIRPPDNATEQKVKSGVALRIEVEEAQKILTRMSNALHVAWARHGRVKLGLAMKHFSVPQLLRYVGADGAAKQEWFTGNSFARVETVAVKSGTGTMLPWSEKVNLALQLQGAGLIDPDEAAEIARPAFTRHVGVADNPHVQRFERQKSSWLEGPPEGWEAKAEQYAKAVALHAEMTQAMLAENPQAPIPPTPDAPWTPFEIGFMDAEPAIAAIRKRGLARLGAKTEYTKFPPAWRQLVDDAYNQAAQALAAAQAPPPAQANAQVGEVAA